METARLTVESPLGPLTLEERNGAIVALDWGAAAPASETPLLAAAARQLKAYFDGRLTRFDLPLAPSGSRFQQAVWDAMCRIPYGTTRSYAEIARALGSVPRAVGAACGQNPIPILIPCHRIVAAANRLGGYSGAGGLETKRYLLGLEGVLLRLEPP